MCHCSACPQPLAPLSWPSCPTGTGGFGGPGSPPPWLPPCQGAPCPGNATLSHGPSGSRCTSNPLPGPRGSLHHFEARKGCFGQRRERRQQVVQQFLPARYKGKTNRKRVRVRVRARVRICAHAPLGAVQAARVAVGDAPGMATEPPPTPGPRGHPSPMRGSAQATGPPQPPACCWHRGDGFPAGKVVAVAACPRYHLPPSLSAASVPATAQTWPRSPRTPHPSRTGRSSTSASHGERQRPTEPT